MYQDVVKSLTKEQIDQLERMGVARSTVSNWKHGKRLPTLPQAKTLALVAMVSFSELIDELADMEATPEQRSFFRTALAQGLAATLVAIFCVLQALWPEPAHAAERALARVSGQLNSAAKSDTPYTLWCYPMAALRTAGWEGRRWRLSRLGLPQSDGVNGRRVSEGLVIGGRRVELCWRFLSPWSALMRTPTDLRTLRAVLAD